jgi:hypothetical protein
MKRGYATGRRRSLSLALGGDCAMQYVAVFSERALQLTPSS